MTDGIDMTVESLKGQLNEIKLKLSKLRKSGLNTRIAELKIMAIPSKIMMLEVTRDYKDMQKIARLIADAKAEADNIKS